jgi:hypothetical protein
VLLPLLLLQVRLWVLMQQQHLRPPTGRGYLLLLPLLVLPLQRLLKVEVLLM